MKPPPPYILPFMEGGNTEGSKNKSLYQRVRYGINHKFNDQRKRVDRIITQRVRECANKNPKDVSESPGRIKRICKQINTMRYNAHSL